MYKKKLQLETAGLYETIDSLWGGIAGGVTDPRAKTIGDKTAKTVANVAGGLGGGTVGATLGAPFGPLGVGAGYLAGKWMGSDALRNVVGNTDENMKVTAGDLNETPPAPMQDPKVICEEFLNKHSSSAEAAEEFNDDPAHVLPPVNENKGKFVASTACSGKV